METQNLSASTSQYIIIGCSLFSIFYASINAIQILKISVQDKDEEVMALKNDQNQQKYSKMVKISKLIQDGAKTFLHEEYIYLTGFIFIFGILIAFTVEKELGQFRIFIPFLLGALTSILSGYIGMMIAVNSNVRTCKEATKGLKNAFDLAYKGGLVLGFSLVGLSLLVLILLIISYQKYFMGQGKDSVTLKELFEYISGYGLGGSTVALFCRVGGGIYTKAADVGSDLVGKVIAGLEEDSPQNPGVIADNVGDNVGDIAGMGSDLFGSFSESTCASLILSSTSYELVSFESFYFPLLITSSGIIVSLLTSFFASIPQNTEDKQKVERALKL